MANAFVAEIVNIGKHIVSGIEKAAPLVEKILTSKPIAAIPIYGPILSELGTVFSNIEAAKTEPLTSSEVEAIVTATVTALQIKAAASAAATHDPAAFTSTVTAVTSPITGAQ
jgi:hypothetical protein